MQQVVRGHVLNLYEFVPQTYWSYKAQKDLG